MSVARERPQARRMPGIWIGLGLALLLLIGFGIWAFNRTRPVSAQAVRRDVIGYVPLTGEVIAPPGERADVGAPFEAPVERVLTTVGARVRKGEVLVELSFPSADAAYQAARTRVRAAETAYANAQEAYSGEVAAAKAQLDQARSAERAARQPAVTVPPVEGETAVPAPQPAADVTAATEARLAAEQALAAAQARREAALLPYAQQLEAAREHFRQAQSGAKMAMIRAPISGTVLALNARPGETVKADGKTAIATVVDLDALEVHAGVPAEQAGYVKQGRDADLTIEGIPNEQFDGQVHSLVTEPAKGLRGPRYLAVLHLENSKGLVKPGMKASGGIRVGEAKDAIAVPADAVGKDGGGRPVVRVMENGRWTDRIVEVGLSDGKYTEIRSGLKEGETVQVKPDLF